MELLSSSSIPILIPSLLFVFLVLKLVLWRSKANLPPGPWKLPIIGNMHQLVGSKELPHMQFKNLAAKYGPIMTLQIGEHPTILVSSAEIAKEVMKTQDLTFSSRVETVVTKIISYDFGGFAFKPYNDEWREFRKMCVMEILCKKKVLAFRSAREEEVSDVINSIASKAGDIVNLTEKVTNFTLDINWRIVFGKKSKEQKMFIEAVNGFARLAAGDPTLGDLFPSLKFLDFFSKVKYQIEQVRRDADVILEKIIEDCKAGKNDEPEALVNVLLDVQKSDTLRVPFTTINIKAILFELYSGGIESSATTMCWALAEMVKHPKTFKKAQDEVRAVFNKLGGKVDESGTQELQYLKLVIKETLRLHPPGPLLSPRECRESCKINGYDIPRKARIICNASALGRDPHYWDDPESFNPERFLDSSIDFHGNNFEFLPFGAGRRMCPGIAFGNANMELPLAMVLYHFDWKLPEGMVNEELDMSETFGLTLKRKQDLLLIPTPYHPPQAAA